MSVEPTSVSHAPPSATPAAPPLQRRFSGSFLSACVVASCLAHGVAYAALSGMGRPTRAPSSQNMEVGFSIVTPPPDEVMGGAAPDPAPKPIAARPRVVRRRPPKARPAKAPVAAKPVPLDVSQVTEAAEATDGGGTLPVQAPAAVANSQPGGGEAGGTGPDQSNQVGNGGTSRIDLRRLTSEWAARVNRAIASRAIREYPRAALRARLQGTVLLLVHVGPDGQLQSVTVARSSGSSQLDDAALAAARALESVPAPPAPIHRYLRPFPVPVNYTIRT